MQKRERTGGATQGCGDGAEQDQPKREGDEDAFAAFVQAQRAERLITILRDAIIPQATMGLQAAQAGYAVGKVDFLTLLNSLLTLQDSQLELHGEMVNHEKALARLEARR